MNKIDWKKVPIDAPVYVRDHDRDAWRARYFAGHENGLIHTWQHGATSWSGDGDTACWNQARLAAEPECDKKELRDSAESVIDAAGKWVERIINSTDGEYLSIEDQADCLRAYAELIKCTTKEIQK